MKRHSGAVITAKSAANWYSWSLSFAAGHAGLLFGYEIGIINSVLEMDPFKLFFGLGSWNQDINHVTSIGEATSRISSIVSFFVLGCIPGALFSAQFADKLGRKRSIWFGALWFMLGAILQAIVPSSLDLHARLAMMLAGRFLTGIGVGMLSMCAPLYIAELAPAKIRGRLTSVQQLMITIGIAFAASVNAIIIDKYQNAPFDNDIQWRLALGLQAAPCLLLVLFMFKLPESPRWLMSRDREDEALKSLAIVRQSSTRSPEVQEEFYDYKQAIELERTIGSADWKELLLPGIWNRVAIACFLQFFQQWSGINSIMFFSASMFIAMGFPRTSALTLNVVIQNVVNVFATIPGMILIERAGRTKLLQWGGILMSLSMTLLAIFVNLFQSTSGITPGTDITPGTLIPDSAKTWSMLGVIAMYAYVACFAATWGPVVWVYQSEIFPMRIRGKGTGLATASNWINNYILTAVWPFVSRALGPNQYIIFAVTGLVMAAYVAYFVPETQGRSLEDMDAVFGFVPKEAQATDLKA
ncbi:general substrate transporter [Catenaria anguillulae PL171]|uniref:General substrate transporter n=1 Tax=Catenaria anguillulae PL171 TaxID=765915 RepID=A0A1Y2HHH9_9FUNG|nr:general substrate transporter [Catenaria anguillulae PL171]